LKLEAWIRDSGFRRIGDPIWARYNPPFTPWFLRRNEILIPISPDANPDIAQMPKDEDNNSSL
jgi:hypothetical protein